MPGGVSRVLALTTIALFVIGTGTAATATGAAYVIHPHGSRDFPTIQAAVVAAIDGDVVELVNGTFRGSGNGPSGELGFSTGGAVYCVQRRSISWDRCRAGRAVMPVVSARS
jgi:hypothetical protein